MSIYIGDKEIKNLFVGESISISDMQGPCPDGFHIPTRDEWTSLKDACTALGIWSTGSDLISYLKMPYCGIRDANTTIYYQGERGTYWTSIRYNANTAYYFNFWTTRIDNTTNQGLSAGSMIRPFKNTSVTPDSNWTVLKQGTGTSGVYWNSDLGLISISSDGSTRITIADKNVGATSTDTSSTSSYGYYFQFGNDYGFPNSGSVTTSSTQVNASTYGPGNYYESSNWVTSAPRESSGNLNLWGGVSQGTTETGAVKAVYLGENKVLPSGPDYLCFTAEQAGSTVTLNKSGSPTSVTLETSTDGITWNTYTIGSTITLSNIGDKVYWRNTSETDTGFGRTASSYYYFSMTGSIAGSGDITFLINKNGTNTLGDNYFARLFQNCTSLTSAPSLPATTLGEFCYGYMFYNTSIVHAPSLPATTLSSNGYCYQQMFGSCSLLEELPQIPATSLNMYCCYQMFSGCSKIKLSTTQTGEYQTPYRIPTTGTGTAAGGALLDMFTSTGGTFKSTPTINTTYYTSNTVV